MSARRIACLLLGLWMGAAGWMLWVAADNQSSADRVLLNPSESAAAYLKTLHAPLTPLAHYLVEAQNRSLLETWGVVQIALATAFFCFLLFGTKLGKLPLALGFVLLLIAIAERAVIAPSMAMVGGHADFNPDPSHRVRLATEALSYGYLMAEWGKFLIAAICGVILVWQQSRRSLDSRRQIDVIDKADYRHIDG